MGQGDRPGPGPGLLGQGGGVGHSTAPLQHLCALRGPELSDAVCDAVPSQLQSRPRTHADWTSLCFPVIPSDTQISVDVPWAAFGNDGRDYDWKVGAGSRAPCFCSRQRPCTLSHSLAWNTRVNEHGSTPSHPALRWLGAKFRKRVHPLHNTQGLAKVSDRLFVMSYDQQAQVCCRYGFQCLGW